MIHIYLILLIFGAGLLIVYLNTKKELIRISQKLEVAKRVAKAKAPKRIRSARR